MPRASGFTYADLEAIPWDGKRRELINGQLIVSPSPRTRHQTLVGRLFFALESHVRARRDATVCLSPLDVVLSDTNVVEPDLMVIPHSQNQIITGSNIRGVPALLVEVVSNSSYDRVRKRDIYERFRVPEYWIIDPDTNRIEILRLSPNGYTDPIALQAGDTLRSPILPGFALDLTTFFAR